jgi:DNA polymerase-3 subunit epsilon
MDHLEYAIVDIETTGGYASANGITEIAILIHDGSGVVERYETLLNPGIPIPLSIQVLTGIDDDMVAGSPVFGEVAARIFGMLAGRVFVAHNVNFDYSFVRHFLALEGFDLKVPRLCTVRLSRRIRPGLPSYSLGRLCRSLDIPLSNRHRAAGDAEATAVLFSRLMTWDTGGHMAAMLKTRSREQRLPPNLPPEQFDALPHCPGVYYFLDREGKAVYVGKARDLAGRVSTHFSGQNAQRQRQQFLRDIYGIRYEVCGTELMAFLLEAVEIGRLWPRYNRAMKHPQLLYGLYLYEGLNGFLRLAVGRVTAGHREVCVFYRQEEGTDIVHKLVRQFGLCPQLCLVGACSSCAGEGVAACARGEGCNAYNRRVREAVDHLQGHLPSFAIVDAGRAEDEQSCIWVENGCFYGMGYVDLQAEAPSPETVKEGLSRYPGNHYMMQLIYDYAEKHPAKVRRFNA